MYTTNYSCILIKFAIFFDRLLKNIKISDFIKIRPVCAELFHVNGRTDGQADAHGETNSHFLEFCEGA